MAAYAEVQDLIDRYGEDEILQLTDRDDSGQVDDTVAQTALDDAEAEVDGYLGGRYELPLESPPRILSRITTDIARYHLHDGVPPDHVNKRYEDAVKFLQKIAEGKVSLGASTAPPSAGAPEVSKGTRMFDDDSLRWF